MVSFSARHEFDAPPASVTATMTDPAFVASLRLPDLDPPEVLEHGAGFVRARFRFVGKLDPIARRILGNDRISWVQEVRFDTADGHGALAVIPDVQPDRMRFAGEYRLQPRDGGGTTRSLRGDLAIRVPVIGRRAENHILPGLLRRIDLEAEALQNRLATGPA